MLAQFHAFCSSFQQDLIPCNGEEDESESLDTGGTGDSSNVFRVQCYNRMADI